MRIEYILSKSANIESYNEVFEAVVRYFNDNISYKRPIIDVDGSVFLTFETAKGNIELQANYYLDVVQAVSSFDADDIFGAAARLRK